MKNQFRMIPLVCSLAMGTSAQASTMIFTDNFSSSGTAGGHRLWAAQADNANWQGSFDTSWGAASAWNTTGGTLNNPVTETITTDANQRANEKPITYLTSVSTADASLNQLTISFDYVVGTGSTLYFHAIGMQDKVGKPPYTIGGTAGNPQVLSTHANNGNVSHGIHMDENFNDINLFDGSHTIGSAASGQSFTGTGTYTGIIDISGYSINKVDDLDYIAVAFGLTSGNTDSTGAVSIDDFSINASAVPEPSSAALLGLGGLALMLRRRK